MGQEAPGRSDLPGGFPWGLPLKTLANMQPITTPRSPRRPRAPQDSPGSPQDGPGEPRKPQDAPGSPQESP